MIRDDIHHESSLSRILLHVYPLAINIHREESMKPVTLINHFLIKLGRLDEFVEAQRRFATSLDDGPSDGLIGGRMYRGADDRSAVLVSQFESAAALESIRQSEAFKQHLKMLEPLVESSRPVFYDEAYSTGSLK